MAKICGIYPNTSGAKTRTQACDSRTLFLTIFLKDSPEVQRAYCICAVSCGRAKRMALKKKKNSLKSKE